MFEGMGFADVGAFRTSGNVVFSAGRGQALGGLTERIEGSLAKSLGYDVAIFLRTADEVRAIAAHRPFDRALVEGSQGKLQVSLLSKRPAKKARDAVVALATDEDRLAFADRELYWLPSGGLLESPLDLDAIARLLGSTTRRTKGTMEQLAAKFFAG